MQDETAAVRLTMTKDSDRLIFDFSGCDPLAREPDRVAADVAAGLVTPGVARAICGVVPGDAAATAALRDAMRTGRLAEAAE
ncbi:MAG: hypothetical protein ACK4OP_03075 [Gemmobacter sp.]